MADGKVKIDIIADDSDAAKKIKDTEESLGGLGEETEKTSKKTKESKTRFQELTEKIQSQSRELESLKADYVETAINLGKNSKEAEELKEKFNALNRELKENEEALEGAKKGLEDVGESSGESEKGLGLLDLVLGDLAAGGIKGFISGIGNAISSLMSLADETREFREDMAKLDTAFKSAGHSVEAGQQAYEDFYAILGESDRAVEAVNHLAELTDNTEDLSKWSTIAAGVTAKFGDSLPIEGLTEAANETAKVGQTTGVLADALNWVSKDSAVFKQSLGGNQKALAAFNKALKEGENVEDAFTAALGKMSSEQERSAAITNTLNGIYADAAGEYNAMTAETQKARRAAAEMEEAQARLGAAFEPLSTVVTEAKSAFFNFAANLAESVSKEIERTKNLTSGLTTEQRLLAEAAIESSREIAELRSAADEAAIGISAQYGYVQDLADELLRLADANGRVKDTDKARVDFILGELNEALGTEYTMTGNLINQYGALKSSIDNVIASKRAEILMAEYETAYAEAIKNRTAIEQAAADQHVVLLNAMSAADEAALKEKEVRAEYEKAVEEGKVGYEIYAVGKKLEAAQTEARNKAALVDKQKEKYDELVANVDQNTADINAYEQAKTAFMQGEYEKGEQILNDWGNGYLEASGKAAKGNEAQIESARNMVIHTSIQLGLLEEEYKEKQGSMTKEQEKEMQARIDAAKKEAQDARAEYYRVGGDSVEGLVKGVEDKDGQPQWNLAGKLGSIVQKGLDKMREVLDSHSPARKTAEISHDAIDGLIVGAEEKRKEAVDEFASVTKDVIGGIEKEMEDGIKDIDKKLEHLDDIRTTANAKTIDAQKKALNKEKKALQERKSAFSEFSRTHEKQLSDMAKLEEDYSKGMVKIQDKLTSDIEKAWSDFENKRESRADSIANSLSLFDEVEKKDARDGMTLTKNLAGQVKELERYNKAIADLSMRNVDSTFLAEMMGLGVDNLPELQALVRMSDEELTHYADLWQEKNRLAGSAAAKSLEGAREETIRNVAGLIDAARTEADGLTSEYQTAMTELLKEVQTGMQGVSEAGVKALGEDLALYFDAGRSMMENVADGIEDGKSTILDAFKSTIDAALIEAGIKEELQATVSAENARYGYTPGAADNGMTELSHAVNAQNAGINSLVKQGASRGGNATVILQVDKRELGRAVIDTGKSETVRAGIKV